MFDFEGFKNEKTAIHCRTKEGAENFLSTLVKMNIITPTEKEQSLYQWRFYKDTTCYRLVGKILLYATHTYYIDLGYKIEEWQEGDELNPEPTEEKKKARTEHFKRVIEHYGKELQTIVAIEEMTELTKALTKELRGQGNKKHIAEEIADVYICLQQLKIMYDIPDEVVEQWIKWKIERTEKRLKGDRSK